MSPCILNKESDSFLPTISINPGYEPVYSSRLLVFTPYPSSMMVLTGVMPLYDPHQTSLNLSLSALRSVDDIEKCTAFKLPRSTKTSPSCVSALYDYGITLHFKDHTDMSLIFLNPFSELSNQNLSLSNIINRTLSYAQCINESSCTNNSNNQATNNNPYKSFDLCPFSQSCLDTYQLDMYLNDWDMICRNIQDEMILTITNLQNRRKKVMLDHAVALSKLAAKMNNKVNWAEEEDEKNLKKMWSLYRPSIPFPGPKHELWKTIGFQGSDPQTDFRGMGKLALHCLNYLGEFHSLLITKLVDSQLAGAEYPLAVAVINFCSLISELVKLKSCNFYLISFIYFFS